MELGREIVVSGGADIVVNGDRLRLEQALGNLVDNALRHATGTVLLNARPGADKTVELHVRDQGRGFPPEFLPHAFERFSRPRSDRAGPGTGLGLSIVQTIAAAHGGTTAAGKIATMATRPCLSHFRSLSTPTRRIRSGPQPTRKTSPTSARDRRRTRQIGPSSFVHVAR